MLESIGAYKFTGCIGAGSVGGVWKCQNITTGEYFACKVVDLENLHNPDFLPHFKNELYIHSHIRHPGITQLKDVLFDNKQIYIFIELCEGGDLNDIVMENNGLSEDIARHYFRQLMSALTYIHELGVAHRDIKLENILVTSDNCAKLTDFGLCKQQVGNSLLLTTCGTLIYAAPEIIQEKPYNGMKADVWSAGIVLYAMVANHFPWSSDESLPPDRFIHETANQIINGEITLPDGISFELQNLLANMLNVDPDSRPTAADILEHPWFMLDEEEPDFSSTEPDQSLIDLVKSVIADLDRRAAALDPK